MPLCPGVQSMSFSLPVLMFYVLCFTNTCKFCSKYLGKGVLFYPVGQTRLMERRNHMGTADDSTLCPFSPCNLRFMGVHISQGNGGLKKINKDD